MEDREKKDKYARQKRYANKTYTTIGFMLRNEWHLYEHIQGVITNKDVTISAYLVNAVVEQAKKEGYVVPSELDEFLQKNYYK